MAVALTGVAARGYRQGTFWPELWKAVRYQGLPEDQTVWGQGFVAAVDSLGMPTLPDMPMPYLGPILMHTGIPTFCLEDYFRLITQRRTTDRGLDAEGFLTWATAPGREKRIQELDVPARRFLQHGTEFALDFVERSFDLLDRLRDSAPDLDGAGLPARVLGRAQELAAEGRLDLSVSRSPTGGRTRTERPTSTASWCQASASMRRLSVFGAISPPRCGKPAPPTPAIGSASPTWTRRLCTA
ncbi:hypothetical protein ACQPYK_39885 [Streptosporangium sp. CA-135522]|uniref:hypothetical protein n=1 Tax=Streptosporangium sp. CA-135522 TaxID=3240072 RepID=UPI003D91BEA7